MGNSPLSNDRHVGSHRIAFVVMQADPDIRLGILLFPFVENGLQLLCGCCNLVLLVIALQRERHTNEMAIASTQWLQPGDLLWLLGTV